jgi:putrescine aminotransferase
MENNSSQEKLEKTLQEYAHYINPSQVEYLKKAGLLFLEKSSQGTRIFGDDGKTYFDCRDDAGVFNLGHRDPQILETLKNALDRYDIGNNLFISKPRLDLAKELATLFPNQELDCVHFGVSGGEIADLSIKMARAISKKKKVIAAKEGYHGCTGLAMTATGAKAYREPFEPLNPDFTHVPYGDAKALEKAITRDTACVILEPIQGHAGVILPPEGYFAAVRDICNRNDVILILDEIQTGLGRTGKTLAIEYDSIVPDMVLLGKPLSGGYCPITAVVYRRKYHDFWNQYPMSHESSFGGNELACIVALKAVQTLRDPKTLAHVNSLAEMAADFFEKQAQDLKTIIEDYRSRGLLMCLQMKSEELGFALSAELCKRGVAVEPLPHSPQKIRIMFDLNTPVVDLQEILKIFSEALKAVSAENEDKHPIRTKVSEVVNQMHP